MLNLISLWKIRNGVHPWSNDPDMNKRYLKLVWRERNYIAIGRGILAWLNILGWGLLLVLVLK